MLEAVMSCLEVELRKRLDSLRDNPVYAGTFYSVHCRDNFIIIVERIPCIIDSKYYQFRIRSFGDTMMVVEENFHLRGYAGVDFICDLKDPGSFAIAARKIISQVIL